MKFFLLIFVAVCVLVVGVFGFRGEKFGHTPIQVFPDMDYQDFVQGQEPSEFFRDGMASRLPVTGTVPSASDDGVFPVEFGEGRTGHYYTGAIGDYFATGMPEELELTADNADAFLRRGQERYGIFCAVCHGAKGDGKGVTAQYGVPNIANFHAPQFQAGQYPEGKMFYVITNGWNLMGAYGANIPVRDRWAIVAYVRALQESQKAPPATASAANSDQPQSATN